MTLNGFPDGTIFILRPPATQVAKERKECINDQYLPAGSFFCSLTINDCIFTSAQQPLSGFQAVLAYPKSVGRIFWLRARPRVGNFSKFVVGWVCSDVKAKYLMLGQATTAALKCSRRCSVGCKII